MAGLARAFAAHPVGPLWAAAACAAADGQHAAALLPPTDGERQAHWRLMQQRLVVAEVVLGQQVL